MSAYRLTWECLQTVVAREVDPLHSQVVSLTRFNTGDNAYNVIPDIVKLGATYRSLTHEGMVNMKKRFFQVDCMWTTCDIPLSLDWIAAAVSCL